MADTDATVAKLEELGGSVTQGPDRPPYGRLTRLHRPDEGRLPADELGGRLGGSADGRDSHPPVLLAVPAAPVQGGNSSSPRTPTPPPVRASAACSYVDERHEHREAAPWSVDRVEVPQGHPHATPSSRAGRTAPGGHRRRCRMKDVLSFRRRCPATPKPGDRLVGQAGDQRPVNWTGGSSPATSIRNGLEGPMRWPPPLPEVPDVEAALAETVGRVFGVVATGPLAGSAREA